MNKIRKTIFAVILSVTVCCNCSCRATSQNNTIEFRDNLFSYDLENVCAFTVYNKTLYTAFQEENSIKSYDYSGKYLKSFDFGDGFHTNLSCDGKQIYSFTYKDDGNYITKYDLLTNNLSEHKIDFEVSSALSMTTQNDKIFLVYWNEQSDAYLESVKYEDDDTYIYLGEKSVSIDTDNFIVEQIDINNVLNLKPYSDNEIIYYAYDDIGGYYFTIYNTINKTFSDKIYNNTPKYAYSFDYLENDIIYSDFNNRKITSVEIDNPDVHVDFIPNVVCVSGNDLKTDTGDCYVLDNKSGNIIRTTYNDTIKKNKEIMFLSSEIYSETPYGCGYRINSSILKDEEFVLNILAENSDYDICMMSSGQTISGNIRDKGSFYKLNDVPMVKEYLDKCFPYLKEAAYDENNNIWMIPIAVNIPCLVYNPKICDENGINICPDITWKNLFEACKKAYEKPENRHKFEVNGYQSQFDILNHYNNYYSIIRGKANYNNELFRNLCTMLKETDIDSDFLHTNLSGMHNYDNLNDYFNNYLFELRFYLYNAFYDEAFSNLRALPTPSLNGNEPGCADCIFFCVNSNSSNLTEALNYISNYCSYMLGRNDNYMLNDENIYPYHDTALAKDLFSIYSNAQVHFSPSNDMFWNDYIDYHTNKISLDSMISEIERKTDMYLNE